MELFKFLPSPSPIQPRQRLKIRIQKDYGLSEKKVEIVLKQQNSDGGKIHKGQEGSIRLVISGGDSAKSLDFPKKHSTRWRSLYRCQSTGQGLETLLCGGIT